jgi:hypothetical protein
MECEKGDYVMQHQESHSNKVVIKVFIGICIHILCFFVMYRIYGPRPLECRRDLELESNTTFPSLRSDIDSPINLHKLAAVSNLGPAFRQIQVRISPDRNIVAISGLGNPYQASEYTQLWILTQSRLCVIVPISYTSNALVAFSPDSKTILLTHHTGEYSRARWDIGLNRLTGQYFRADFVQNDNTITFEYQLQPDSLAQLGDQTWTVSDQSRYVLEISEEDNQVHIIDLLSGDRLGSIRPARGIVRDADISLDGSLIAIGSTYSLPPDHIFGGGYIELWEIVD